MSLDYTLVKRTDIYTNSVMYSVELSRSVGLENSGLEHSFFDSNVKGLARKILDDKSIPRLNLEGPALIKNYNKCEIMEGILISGVSENELREFYTYLAEAEKSQNLKPQNS